MDKFPDTLIPKRIKKFPADMREIVARALRYEVYTTVLSGDPENYYDVSSFKFHAYADLASIISEVREELHLLGWTTAMSYGNTGLFVYCGKKPANCW